jgi:hypothetical protein
MKSTFAVENEYLARLRAGQTVRFDEPCDCGARTMHHNGGNYHRFVEARMRGKTFELRFGDTCELTPPAELERYAKYDCLSALTSARSDGWSEY